MTEQDQNSEKKKPEKVQVEVSIDDKAQQQMNEKLLAQNERYMRALLEKREDEKLEQNMANKDLRFSDNSGSENSGEKGPAPAGDVPLSTQQLGNSSNDLKHMKFPNAEAMITHLRDLERQGSPEARQILDQLFMKYVMNKKENLSKPDLIEFNPNSAENLPECAQIGERFIPKRPEDGDLGRYVKMWRDKNERVRRARAQLERGEENV